MTLSEMRSILSERELMLTKSLGQNFLHDQNQLRRIVAAAELTKTEKVLEIGPGLGPLTELLVENAGQVMAIEKDRRLFDFLTEKFSAAQNLNLIHDDALRYAEAHRDWGGWKLVANLPYSVASPILIELAEAEQPPERMVATLQLEVAHRIDAKPDCKQYGVLGLLLRLRYDVSGLFKIPAACFFPTPNVESACIVLTKKSGPPLSPTLQRACTKIVKRGFSQRRKMLLKLLKQDWAPDRLEAAFAKLNLSPQIRAEKLELSQFIQLAEILSA